MEPVRQEIICGRVIEEDFWRGKIIVYVDNCPVATTFKETCDAVRAIDKEKCCEL